MANATTKLLAAGLLVVLPVSASDPKRGQAAQHAVPDVMVYVESELVASYVLHRAEATATRMFAGIGVRVQWADRRPGRRAEPASGGCAPKRPEEIVVRMASGRARYARGDVFAYALPYASDGVRVTVFYDELRKAFCARPRLESAVLAHVLVHEITHVLQGEARHSSTGVMRAHWNSTEYSDLEKRPMEFAGDDAELIQLGLRGTQSPACVGTASALSVRD
jgi:hypothetical protein